MRTIAEIVVKLQIFYVFFVLMRMLNCVVSVVSFPHF